MTLTMETLLAAAKLMPPAPAYDFRIISDSNCLKETNERLFPKSRHRSKRIRKKLMKRFGGEYRKVPAMFKFGNRIFAHPAIYQEVLRTMERANG